MSMDQGHDFDVEPQLSGDLGKRDLNQQLRTGLNDILGFAEILEIRIDDPNHESIQQILRAGRQLLDLIGGKLQLPDPSSAAQSSSSVKKAECQDVLYVEDNDTNFVLVSRILEARSNINLLRVECGETAVQLAREHQPRLILLDLNLPDIHGAEVLQRLSQHPETKSIPVVVISADATPSQIERLLAAGARHYVTKPFSIKLFLAVVDEILEESAAHRS
jgi:CheY-like chemotaxis protein